MLVEGSDANRLVTDSINKCRATNIMSELKFSRIIKHLMSSVFGRATGVSTMAGEHFMAESSSTHSRAVAAWEKADVVPKADIKLFSPMAKSGRHLYLSEQRAHGINMADIGNMRHELTHGEQGDYNNKAYHKSDEDRFVESLRTTMPNDRTPLGLGDKSNPIRNTL